MLCEKIMQERLHLETVLRNMTDKEFIQYLDAKPAKTAVEEECLARLMGIKRYPPKG